MSFDRNKLFSTKAAQPVQVTACGETFPVYVRRVPALDLRKYYVELTSTDIDVRARAGFDALVKSIRNEDGSPFATLDEYQRMDASAIKALMAAFSEVNTSQKDPELGNA